MYVAVAAGLLGRLALGHWLLARLWKRSRPACDAGWAEAARRGLAPTWASGRAVALRIAEGPAMPMTWGSLRPRILLPAEARGWTGERRRIVLLHELAHVARLDSLGQAAAAIVCAIYWFNPAVWFAARQMRREQEHACDDLVLALGAKASVYARNLLDAAIAFQTPRIGLGVAMASPSELERRLNAIIRYGSRRRSGIRFMAGCGVAALVATSLVASVVPVPAASPDAPEVPPVPPVPPVLASAPSAAAPPTNAVPPVPTVAPAGAPALVTQPAIPPAPPSMLEPMRDSAPETVAAAAGDPYAGDDYDRALAQYRRDLVTYREKLGRYYRDLADHRREVRALRDQGNLANGGDIGNSGFPGTVGRPAIPAHGSRPAHPALMPTPPIPPNPPTPPTPVNPPQQGP